MTYGDKFGNGGMGNDEIINTAENTSLRGVLSRVVYSKTEYGERVGVRFENGVLVEGVLMRDQKSGVLKVFGWSEFEGKDILPEDYTADDAPEEYDYHHPQGVNSYDLVAARLVPDDGEPSGEEYVIGDMITYEGGSAKPKAFSRMLVYTLATNPDNMILDKENIYGWLNPNVQARPELVGRELYYVKYLEPSNRGSNFFQMPQVIDVETGEVIIKEGASDLPWAGSTEEAASEPAPATDGGVAAQAAPAPTPEPAPASSPVDEFVTTMLDLQVDDEAQILAQLESLVSADGHDLTRGAVEAFGGEAEVVNAILG